MGHHSKQELRSYLREKLAGVSSAEVAAASLRVVQELQVFLEKKSEVSSVLLYESLNDRKELSLSSLPTLLPNISFEVLENSRDAAFPQKQFDVIIVPLLGFNKDGYRLGHGGGWYDRFLATQPDAFKIGVGYENSLVEFAPEPHDVRMNAVVTEKQLRRFHSS